MSIQHPVSRNEQILHRRQFKPSWAEMQRQMSVEPASSPVVKPAHPMDEVVGRVALRRRLTMEQIKSFDPNPLRSHPRHEAMYELHLTGRWSYAAIGRYFAREASRVLESIKLHRKRMEKSDG